MAEHEHAWTMGYEDWYIYEPMLRCDECGAEGQIVEKESRTDAVRREASTAWVPGTALRRYPICANCYGVGDCYVCGGKEDDQT